MSYVRINNLVKAYDDQVVLDNVDVSIHEGELVSILGPSGCGKSTLLRTIAGLTDISSGEIFVGDEDITRLSPKQRQTGMVFQSYALFPNMTVFHNIAFGLKMDGVKKDEYIPLVEEMISVIDLKGFENRYPHQLSGGQQQRVALGRALVKRPKILMLDEPLSALDARIRRSLRNTIRDIQQKLNMTTIFVTHDQEEALTISDRIYVMNKGTVEQIGTPTEIYTSPRTEYVARFIGNYNVLNQDDLTKHGFHNIPTEGTYAIRPEAISIEKVEHENNATRDGFLTGHGTVSKVHILGNVIRFDVDMNGLDMRVDLLHDERIHEIKEGSVVEIAVPLKECKLLKE